MLENFVKENYGKNLGQLSLDETYAALLKLVRKKRDKKRFTERKSYIIFQLNF